MSLHLVRRLPVLPAPGTALFLCDIQSRFAPLIHQFPAVVQTARKLIRGAAVLDLPVIVTEQNPRALGHTVDELEEELRAVGRTFRANKMKFSMWTHEVRAAALNPAEKVGMAGGITSAVLFGIESHVCVLQTCLDLLADGIAVHVVADGVSSMNAWEIEVALTRMRDAGAVVTTSDSVLFQMMGTAEHAKFREVSQLVKAFSESTRENELMVRSRM